MTKQKANEYITKAMNRLQSINALNYTQKEANQKKINEAFNILDEFKKELNKK